MEQPTGTPTPARVVACAGGLIGSLSETLWAAKTSTELVETVEQLEKLRAQVAAATGSVLAEVHARGVAKGELAWGSTAEWFTHLAGPPGPPATRSSGRRGCWWSSGRPRTPR